MNAPWTKKETWSIKTYTQDRGGGKCARRVHLVSAAAPLFCSGVDSFPLLANCTPKHLHPQTTHTHSQHQQTKKLLMTRAPYHLEEIEKKRIRKAFCLLVLTCGDCMETRKTTSCSRRESHSSLMCIRSKCARFRLTSDSTCVHMCAWSYRDQGHGKKT